MRQIAEIVEAIREELNGAAEYAKKATKYKATDKPLADAYYTLSMAELGHVDTLHAQVVRMIAAQKTAGTEVPSGMQAVWDWEHDQMMDHVSRVKVMLDMYKK